MNYICIAEEGERDLITKYLPNCTWPVIVTGVGAINVIQALSEVPREASLLNIGFAGSANFDIGTVVEVTEVGLNHPNVSYPEPKIELTPFDDGLWPIAQRKAVCYTNCDFVMQSDYKDCVFDMELAFIASLGFASVSALKIVSDNLSLHDYHQITNGVQ